MSTIDKWRKSSRSNSESACVELSISPVQAGVRDSKNRDGEVLKFDPASFRTFLAELINNC